MVSLYILKLRKPEERKAERLTQHTWSTSAAEPVPSTLSTVHSSTALGMESASLLKAHFCAQPGPKPTQPYTCRAETNAIKSHQTRPGSALYVPTAHRPVGASSTSSTAGWRASTPRQDSGPLLTRPHRRASFHLTCGTLWLRSLEPAEQVSASHPTHVSHLNLPH